MSLYKFIQTRSKNRVIENRVMENRVKRGITVLIAIFFGDFHTDANSKFFGRFSY